MKRKIITTGDGSKTIQISEWNEQYHSTHGAIQEAEHVYINSGLEYFKTDFTKEILVLEIGFGTGLNALLTSIWAEKQQMKINYTGVEAFPVSSEEIQLLNYSEQLVSTNAKQLFKEIHNCKWEKFGAISEYFNLKKIQIFFDEIQYQKEFDVIYFDAFGARVQPELWTEQIFKIMYEALRKNGVLVTYSAKGSARRAMKSVGFQTEVISGPPGKRHMIRAVKF
ncbi:tRNA (5-methylaminomethyl-2-thiouridine)(34)-methyltransferase MnmD [Psychroflexus aestuariivivens]|uniref:tRNA (5-methylaminomethyl-2-thiouridine)(34)-methyltransferase MnmD n=1 Tax=Psychroflexus aestuariivivens TaxID=1795040 RepID=UPI000FD82AD6|nr:tRNA (5-methylaminomethyl-2-thiouridine)(34)-methyltransferase MnmD [Psychroflexus aestuariivivens]